MPSVSARRWNARERVVVGRGHVRRRGRSRAARRAPGRRRGSRARRRSSARRRSGRPRRRAPTSARRAGSPARPQPSDAAPAASTPISRTSASSTKPAKAPIAFEPPPTHATTASGSRPSTASICSRASRPITACSSRTISGYGVGPDARPDQVVGRLDVRDPVADRLARRLLQRPRPELDRPHLGAEQAHPLDVRPLPAHVLGAHVDDALEPEAGAHRRRRDPVLAGAGLGDDPPLAEPHAPAAPARARCSACARPCAAGPRASGRARFSGANRSARVSGVGRPAYVVSELVEARRGTPRRPAPPPSPRSARRAPGSASRGRTGRRTRRSQHRAAST